MHLALMTENETIHVHVGPPEYPANQRMTFSRGDQVIVTGSRIKGKGFEAVLARTVTKGDAVITLRGEHGMPRWEAMSHN